MVSRNLSSSKTNKLSSEEQELFRKAVENVRPLKTTGRFYFPHKTKSKSKKYIEQAEALTLSDPFSPDITSEQTISFFRPGIHQRIFKKASISAALDLHGETIESARAVLTEFLLYCTKNNYRYVRIIHGKGHHAVLKNQVYHWLPQFPAVLAFESAAIRDGGTGAVNVLLKM